MWEEELAGMRVRIKQMRSALLDKLAAAGVKQDLSFITRQRACSATPGLSKAQMQRLRSEFGIYGVDSGRICVAALNSKNIDAVVAAIAKVVLTAPTVAVGDTARARECAPISCAVSGFPHAARDSTMQAIAS